MHKKNFLIALLNGSVSDSVCVYLITEKRFESFMSLKINAGKKTKKKHDRARSARVVLISGPLVFFADAPVDTLP